MYCETIAQQIINLINKKVHQQIQINRLIKEVPQYTATQTIQGISTNMVVIVNNNNNQGISITRDYQPAKVKPQKIQQQRLQIIKQKLRNYQQQQSRNESFIKSMQMSSSMRKSKLIMSLKKTRNKISRMNRSQDIAESVTSQKLQANPEKFIKCIEEQENQNISLKIARQKKFTIQRSLQQFKIKEARYVFEKQQKNQEYKQRIKKCQKYTFSYDGEFVEVNSNANQATTKIKRLPFNFGNLIKNHQMRKTKTQPSIIQNAKIFARKQRIEKQESNNQFMIKQSLKKQSMLAHLEQKDIQCGVKIVDDTGIYKTKPRKVASLIFQQCNRSQFQQLKQKKNKLYTQTLSTSLEKQKKLKMLAQSNSLVKSIKVKKAKKINFLTSIKSLQQSNILNEKFPQQLAKITSTLATDSNQSKKLPFVTNFSSYLGSGRMKSLLKPKLQKIQISNSKFFEQLLTNEQKE